jgi:hypothetical protein
MERDAEALAARGVRVLDEGLRTDEGELVRTSFARWAEDHGNPTLARTIKSLNLGPSYRLGVQSFRSHVRGTLEENGTEAAVQLLELIDRFSKPPQPSHTGGDQVDFRRNTFHAPVIGVQYNYAPSSPSASDAWPCLGEVPRLALGIRPTRRFGDEPELPPYVPRDCDAVLDRLLADRLPTGGLVVVTGEPLSGKTRTAWAALCRTGGADTRVLNAAHPGTDLRELPAALRGRDRSRSHVVWLDDLEGHVGAEGLTAGLLAQCVHEGVLVLATMCDEAYDTHRFGDGPIARVLSGAPTVELTCRWTKDELARLTEVDDARLVDALRHRGSLGVTQFLAVAPELWEEWRRARRPSARPSGYRLVQAAVDMARCGLTAAVPPEVFEDWMGRSLAEDDLAWAARPRLGVVGLLTAGEETGTWRAGGPLVADALRSPDLPPVGPDDWVLVAHLAQEFSRDDFDAVVQAGRAALRASGETGEVEAMMNLAELAALAEDDSDARHWYRRVAEWSALLARPFGEYLAKRGEYGEAIHYLEKAAEAGDPTAMHDLGPLLLTRAEHWLAQAAEAGSKPADVQLVTLRKALAEIRATVDE